MPRQCICTVCKCGRHRCPHNRSYGNRVITKTEPADCLLTEYGGSYSTRETKRGPFYKPNDHLVTKGDIDFVTSNREQFKAKDIEMQRIVREPEVYIPPSEKMNLLSEYNQKFINDGQNQKAVQSSYLKGVTQDIPNGRLDDLSIQKQDYKPWSASKSGRTKAPTLKQEYEPPSGPFNATSVQRSDYKRHNTVTKLTGRMPDNLRFSDGPLTNDTTNRSTYKVHAVSQVNHVHKTEKYVPHVSPFMDNSLSRTDFPDHKVTSRAQIHKPVSTIFQTTSPFQTQTTHSTEFKRWVSTAPANVKRQEEPYHRPSVAMETKSTSKDYGSFEKTTRPAKNARPTTRLRTNKQMSFNDTSNYTNDYPRHDVSPMKRVTVPQQRHTTATNRFDGTSEHRDVYTWHSDGAPKRQRPPDEYPISHEKINSVTQYAVDFPNYSQKECPAEKALLEGKHQGMTFEDDPDTGHRYLVMPPLRSAPTR